MKDKPKEIFDNRAALVDDDNNTEDCTDFECCAEELVFAMQDTKHKFSLGLTTVLECLDIAERNGYVPKLPGEWWIQVHRS